MVPLIGLVGKSGSGKTTLMTALIRELKARGHKVAAIKHTRHEADIDRPGKDSALYREAGAAAVALASPDTIAMHMPAEGAWDPEEIAKKLFPRVDVVLVEGFGDAAIPRIAVMRKGVAEEAPNPRGLIAVAADYKPEVKVPVIPLDDVKAIAGLVETYIRRLSKKRDVALFVNERRIFIKPFIKDFFLKTIAAMVETLKDTGNADRIDILIDKPRGEAEEEGK
jgi:molybdopterin-guanine dinucleotide biosynthesis protein MobB